MSLKQEILIRTSLVYLGVLLIGLLILGKTIHLQLFEKDEWAQEENSTVRHKVIEANRGNIYSADGRLLAVSVPYYEIRMDFRSEAFTRAIVSGSSAASADAHRKPATTNASPHQEP